MELPRPYISYSQIRVYQSCPRKYYYTYIKKLSVPTNDKVFLGIVFHAVIEYYFREKINGIESSKEVLQDQFAALFDGLQKDRPITWESPQKQVIKRGTAFVNYFLRQMAGEIQPLMVEKELLVDLPGIDVPLKGVLDLVEKDFSITDFKTTTARWTKSRIKSSYLQVVIYRYLFEKTFGDVISFLKFKIIYSKNASSIRHQEVEIKPKDIDYDYNRMLDVIKYVVDNIRQGVFYKNESFVCGFCEFRDFCRSDNEPPV